MNVLFVLYHDFHANSAIQVHHFANALADLGCTCAIAVPNNKASCETHIGGDIKYTPLTFEESLSTDLSFFDNGRPDIIHAWTPREIVRKQCLALKKRFPDSKLLVDLEDNEELILESTLNISFNRLAKLSPEELAPLVPHNLSHPIYYKEFLAQSDGVTVIMDTLLEFVPDSKPSLVLWPILNEERFFEREKSPALLKKWGITDDEIVIAYVGNVHSSNWKEVRSLYLAVALANRQGIRTNLVRAGSDYYPFWGAQKEWAEKHTVELGLLPNLKIPEVLANSDLLIQPGKADKFNNYRLPSKIPEFLAMKKPVAMPNSNIGRFLQHEKEALILEKGDALEILNLIIRYAENREGMNKIAAKGQRYALENFNSRKIGKQFKSFLTRVLATA